ncbi:MAG: hypothetical protein MK077_10480 [Phycisphaerales bacterium]|nr:hypothetical protein [Phycisphaerales bacterium]
MNRITRWVPELKDYFKRTVAKTKIKHESAANLDEHAVADKQQREERQASASNFANKCPSNALCRGCEIGGVQVECSFSTRVPGGKARSDPHKSCLLCSETRLKSHGTWSTMFGGGSILVIARSLKTFYAWREEHPAVYDAAMDRITRWVPQLKDNFERAVTATKGEHKPPAQESVKGPTRTAKRKREGT